MLQENFKGANLAKVLQYYGLINYIGKDIIKIVCPFHRDINPSLIVDLQKGEWFCFGCNLSGDAIKFVYYVEYKRNQLNELQALIKYTKILTSAKTEHINIGLRTKRQTSKEQQLIEAQDFYYNLSSTNWMCRPSDKEAEKAILYMRMRGFSFKTLTECGCKYTYGYSYPLIFPLLDNGDFKGWVCRTTNKQIEQKRKYLYNEGFSRRTTLCGHYDNESILYVVEGYIDMLKARTFGINNVVAVLGWKMTSEQILKLKKLGIKRIISALDNDTCGKQGTAFLKGYFNVIRFCYDDTVKDLGELTQQQFDVMNDKTMKQIQ